MAKLRNTATIIAVLLLFVLVGCTADDPGFTTIVGTPEVTVTGNPDVTVTGNPEIIVVDADGDVVAVDVATRTLATVEFEYHEIHAGNSFSCWYGQSVSDTGDKSVITFRTPDTTKWLHLTATFSATVMAHARVYEAPAVVDDTGATLSVYNRNRSSLNTSTVWDTFPNPDTQGQATYFTEATMGNVVGGTEIAYMHLGTGEGKKTIGGDERATQEWILGQNALYAFVIESVNDDDNTHVITLDWYEHTNLD